MMSKYRVGDEVYFIRYTRQQFSIHKAKVYVIKEDFRGIKIGTKEFGSPYVREIDCYETPELVIEAWCNRVKILIKDV